MRGSAAVQTPDGEIDMRANVTLSPELTAQDRHRLRRYAQEDGRIMVPAVIGGTVGARQRHGRRERRDRPRAAERDEAAASKGLFDRIIE